jgi:hypothetical protein
MHSKIAELKRCLFNPFARRLNHRAGSLIRPLVVWLALLTSLLLSLTGIVLPREQGFLVICGASAMLATPIVTPLFLSGLAGNLVAKYIRSAEHVVLRLTPLTEAEIVWGYAVAALYRGRAALAFMLGFAPWHTLLAFGDLGDPSSRSPLWATVTSPPMFFGLMAVVVFYLLGLCFLVVCAAVFANLWWNGASPAGAISFVAAMALSIWIATRLPRTVFAAATIGAEHVVWLLGTLLFPYLLGIVFLRAGQFWARSPARSASTYFTR